MKSKIRSLIILLALGASILAQARWISINAGYLDSSQNLYSAQYLTSTDSQLVVSKINSTHSSDWVSTVPVPAGYDMYGQPLVGAQVDMTVDHSGNVFVAFSLVNAITDSQDALGVAKFSSSGVYQGTWIYQPTSLNIYISGLAVDSNGNVYLAGQYGTQSEYEADTSFIAQLNNNLGNPQVLNVLASGYTYTLVSDIVADGGGNVYIGATGVDNLSGNSVACTLMAKYNGASFAGGPQWQSVLALPPSYDVTGPTEGFNTTSNGCLTLDSSSRLTYIVQDTNVSTNQRELYGIQRTTGNALNWTNNFPAPSNFTSSTTADSSGNIIVLAPTEYETNFVLTKITAAGVMSWTNNYTNDSIYTWPTSTSIDVDGSVFVGCSLGQGSTSYAAVLVFSGSTGAYSSDGGYTDTPADSCHGYFAFASPTTSGTLYLAGQGAMTTGGPNYPLAVVFTNWSLNWVWFL